MPQNTKKTPKAYTISTYCNAFMKGQLDELKARIEKKNPMLNVSYSHIARRALEIGIKQLLAE